MTGVIMVLAGLLRAGKLVRFVSTAVMTGLSPPSASISSWDSYRPSPATSGAGPTAWSGVSMCWSMFASGTR